MASGTGSPVQHPRGAQAGAQPSASEARARILASMPEGKFQTRVVQLARFHGFTLVYHTHDSRRSQPGFPDLVLVKPGRILFRELKSARGRVSADQQDWLDGLAAAGQDAGVWRPADLDNGRILTELKSAGPLD